MTLRFASLLGALVLGSVSSMSAQDRQGAQATPDLREFYAAYEAALKAHRRDTIAQFYHAGGALIVVNGIRMALNSAQIDSTYRGPWEGPAFFAFDNLQFHTISPAQVVVTGGFRWLSAQSADTTRYVYLAIIDRTPTGPRIRVEHETERPPRQR
jgi:hypothetical protein